MKSIQKPSLIIVLTLLCTSASPNTKKKTLDEFEKTIDRFEAEMMRRDRESFSTGDESANALKADEPVSEVQGRSVKIESNLPGGKDLENINRTLGQIDNDIDTLAKDVEAFKAKAFQTATVGNLIDIDVALAHPDRARLKSLIVKLDGYELFSVNDSNHLPLPATVVPVFSGPLQPGNHKLHVEARVAISESTSTVPLNSSAYKHSSSELNLEINDGKYNKRVVIALNPPTNPKDELKITLESSPQSSGESAKEASH